MTDKLIKTDGTSSGLTLGSAIADTDAFEVQQAFVAPASTQHQTFAAVKTWIKAWITKYFSGVARGKPIVRPTVPQTRMPAEKRLVL